MAFQVPVRQVQTQGVGGAPIREQSINAPAAAFGGATAQALQGVGQGLSQASQVLGSIAIEQQDKQDTSLAIENYNYFRDAWRGKDAEFKKRQGIDSFGVTKDATKEFDKMVESFTKGMGDGVKRRFAALAQQSRNSSLNGMANFEQVQSKNAFNTQMQSVANTAINDALEDFSNPETINNSEVVINTAVRGMLKGQPEEVINEAIRNQNTLLHGGIVEKIAIDSPISAKAYLDANKDKMDAKTVTKLERGLDTALEAYHASAIVGEVFDPEKTVPEMRDAVNKKTKDSGIRKDAMIQINKMDKERKAAEKEQATEAFGALHTEVFDNGMIVAEAKRRPEWSLLNPTQKESLQKSEDARAENKPVVTDIDAWLEIQDQIDNDPQGFANRDLTIDAHRLSRSDLQKLRGQQSTIRNGKTVRTDTQLVNGAIDLLGIDRGASASDSNKKRAETFWRRYNIEVQKASALLGKEPDTTQKTEILDRLSIEVVTEVGTFFDDKALIFEIGDVEGVPIEMVDQIAVALSKNKIEVTPENIKKTYDVFLRGQQ